MSIEGAPDNSDKLVALEDSLRISKEGPALDRAIDTAISEQGEDFVANFANDIAGESPDRAFAIGKKLNNKDVLKYAGTVIANSGAYPDEYQEQVKAELESQGIDINQ